MINILAATEVGKSLGDKLLFGLQVTAIGIVMVFILLTALIYLMKLLELISKHDVKKAAAKKAAAEILAPDLSLDESVVSSANESVSNNADIAAIMGALSIVLSESTVEGNSDAKFVVRSIKKFNSRRI
ncbi:MAG: OadG family transporter subunit [Clostridia bacterium]